MQSADLHDLPPTAGRLNKGGMTLKERVKQIPWEDVGLPIVFLLMCLTYSLISPNFLTLRNITNVLLQSSALFFLAMGQTVCILSAGLDLSQGSVVSLVSVVTADSIKRGGIWLGGALGIVSGTFCGFLSGLFVGMAGISPIIVTIGMLYMAGGAAMVYTKGTSVFGLPEPDVHHFFWFGGGYIGAFPVPVIMAMLGVVVMWYVLRYTRFGRHVYAVGGNEQVAIMSGINVKVTKLMIYTLSGLLTSIGSFILSARVISGQPTLGAGGLLLQSIGAVILGGTSVFGGEGGVLKTLMGVLVIAFMVNGLNLLAVSTFIQDIIVGGIIIITVWASTLKKRR